MDESTFREGQWTNSFFKMFRVLLPSWKFFVQFETLPLLQMRSRCEDGAPSLWQDVLIPPRRRWFHLFLNPQGNSYLACQTLVERWWSEVQSSNQNDGAGPAAISTTGQLIENLVRFRIFEQAESIKSLFRLKPGSDTEVGSKGLSIQWRLARSVECVETTGEVAEEIYISAWKSF